MNVTETINFKGEATMDDGPAAVEQALKEAHGGPVVAAAPGYLLLDKKRPNAAGEPVLAWRVGRLTTLPVTASGDAPLGSFVVGPDGRVSLHGRPGCVFDGTLAQWRGEFDRVATAKRVDGGDVVVALVERAMTGLLAEVREICDSMPF